MTEFKFMVPEVWTVIESAEDWHAVTNIDPEDGPAEYPCMVMQIRAGGETIYSVMHVEAAVMLCEAAGLIIDEIAFEFDDSEDEDE
jgi:hypothetical protein